MTTTKPTMKMRLEAISAELTDLVSALNTRSAPCECCQARRYEDFNQQKTAEKLRGYAEGLTNLAKSKTPFLDLTAPSFLDLDLAAPKAEPGFWDTLGDLFDAKEETGPDWTVIRIVERACRRDLHVHQSATYVLAKIAPVLRAHRITPWRSLASVVGPEAPLSPEEKP